jgi:hypothetical protein
MDFCLDLFGTTKLPISFLENAAFQALAKQACPLETIPTGPQLRQAIIDKAEAIRSAITAESEGSPFVTLLVDAATAARRLWHASVIVTAKRVHFWRLHEIPNKETEAIAASISAAITELTTHRLRVVAVVTDNGSDEVAALNPQDHKSIQRMLHRHVLRIPCFSHGTNLAISDWAKKDLEVRMPFRKAMEILIGELHDLPRNEHLHNAPLITSRVGSIWVKESNMSKTIIRPFLRQQFSVVRPGIFWAALVILWN